VKEIVHHPEAKRDMIAAARFFEERMADLGFRFLKALDVTILKIASNPKLYSVCEKPVRSCRVNGFPYRVLFVGEPGFVLILAISHLARRVGWWRGRVD